MRRVSPEYNLDASLEYLDKNTIPGERWIFPNTVLMMSTKNQMTKSRKKYHNFSTSTIA